MEIIQGSLDPTTTYLTYTPTDPNGIMVLANAYMHLGQNDLAISALSTVMETHPEIIEAPLMRGEIYMTSRIIPKPKRISRRL